jgi:hypothetical protein
MLHPLVSLVRNGARVTFYESSGGLDAAVFPSSSREADSRAVGARRRFSSVQQALSYLSYWRGNASAVSELQWLAHKVRGPAAGQLPTSNDGLQTLAAQLVAGSMVVLEWSTRPVAPGTLTLAPKAGASIAALPALAAVPTVPAVPNLTVALDLVQIEAVEVMPEVNATLVQVNYSIKSVDSSTTALGSSTVAVPAIQPSIDQASSSSTQQLAAV